MQYTAPVGPSNLLPSFSFYPVSVSPPSTPGPWQSVGPACDILARLLGRKLLCYSCSTQTNTVTQNQNTVRNKLVKTKQNLLSPGHFTYSSHLGVHTFAYRAKHRNENYKLKQIYCHHLSFCVLSQCWCVCLCLQANSNQVCS